MSDTRERRKRRNREAGVACKWCGERKLPNSDFCRTCKKSRWRATVPHLKRGMFRSRAVQLMKKMWHVPKQDHDLWHCGKVEHHG